MAVVGENQMAIDTKGARMDQPTQELHLCRVAFGRSTTKAPLARSEDSSPAIGMSPTRSRAARHRERERDRAGRVGRTLAFGRLRARRRSA